MTRWGRFRGGIAANDLSRRASHRTICVDDALHFGGSRCLSAGTGGRAQKVLQDPLSAPVAQWIEQRFPKPRAQVRFLSGALAGRHCLVVELRQIPAVVLRVLGMV